MLKVSTFAAEGEYGLAAVPLFGPADSAFEKTASVGLLPAVLQYIEGLRPRSDAQYVLVNALGAGEYYGCFPAGTLVETQEGEVPIEGVEPGTFVRTHKNRFRRVVARTPKKAGELCDLYVQGLSSLSPALTATPNHELWVITRDDFLRTKRRVVWKGDTSVPLSVRREQAMREMEFSWVPIGDLRPGDYIAEPFPLEEDPAALGDEKWNTPECAFLMGLYAAEGCLGLRYGCYDKLRNGEFSAPIAQVKWSLNLQEHALRERLVSCLKFYGRSSYVEEIEETNSQYVSSGFQELGELCLDHIGKLATEKKLSSALLQMPRGWQEEFFRAYSLGDGCTRGEGKEEGTVRCVSASAELLHGVRLLLARLGLAASISGRHNTKATWYNGNPIYELAVSGGQLRGHGTSKSYLHPDGFILSSVKKVEHYDWEGEVYDLTVEEDSSFVASGIAVHNSNVNGDHFPEAALIHEPENATGNPLLDRAIGKKAHYGYLTFYNAHPFAHHRNKDPSRAYGEVELSVWNDHMKRVELVVRVDYDKCVRHGGTAVWDKLKKGQFPDVSMGCFLEGTLVTMADGTRKPIEEIQEGDRVLTHRGRPRRVRGTMKRPYEGDVYTIKPEAGAPIRCTEKHPFFAVPVSQVKAKTYKGYQRWLEEVEVDPDWIPARDVSGHVLVEPVVAGTLTPDYASREFCRLLGYYLAEGHILRNKKGESVGIQLSTHRLDAVHLEIEELCQAVVTDNPPAWADSSTSQKGKYVYIHDRWLAEKCEELAGRGAKTKKLAEEVLHWHPELQAELLGAFVNGDGCSGGKGTLKLSTASRDLAFQFLAILPRLGVAASLQVLNHKAGKGFSRKSTKEWVVHIGKQFVAPFIDRCSKLVPEPVFKTKNARKFFDDLLLTPVRKVKKEWLKTTVYNIDVDEDDSYQIGNLAVHNSKVPFDTSSITLDWKLYREAQASFNPKKHKHEGQAVLEFHKERKEKDGVGIKGLSITRKDYDEWCLTRMNQILPDGRKVFVYNDYPRFFDISFVFIGADRTAKVMVYIVRSGRLVAPPSALVAERMGTTDPDTKTASIDEHLLAALFQKKAEEKSGEFEKEVSPNLPPGKAIPLLTEKEKDLPKDVRRLLKSVPLESALSTLSGMGIVLKPEEYEDIAGDKKVPLNSKSFMPPLARTLLPMLSERSALGPLIEERILMVSLSPKKEDAEAASLSSKPLRKMGSTYNAYRRDVMDLVAHSQNLLESAALPQDEDLHKLAAAETGELFTPLTFEYLNTAYLDTPVFGDSQEAVVKTSSQAEAGVQRGLPSRITW